MPILAVDPAVVIPLDLRGRNIVILALALLRFWGRHKDTLAPAIDPRLSSILDNLTDAILLIEQITVPGPE